MLTHLKFALRSLGNSPGFTVIVVSLLALGIGANTAIFSLFHQLLLRPLPVPQPDRLVNLSAPGLKPGSSSSSFSGTADDIFTYPMFRDLERIQKPFTGIAAYGSFQTSLAHKNQVASGTGLFVSGRYFSVLGLQPELGRLITPNDDAKIGVAPVVVLSYEYWQTRFAASPNVLNDTLRVNGQPLTIVGVAPRRFEGTTLGEKPWIFIPITMKEILDRNPLIRVSLAERSSYWVNLFARLKPGLSIEQARAQINVPYRAILNDVEAKQDLKLHFGLSPQQIAQFRAKTIALEPGSYGRSVMRSRIRTPILLLAGVTGLVLLIACANIMNLLLARNAGRTGELALRASLGATPGRIARELLAESCLLALCGGILGLALARWTLNLVSWFLPAEFAESFFVTINLSALIFAMAVAFAASLLFGALPALRSTKVDLLSVVKGQSASIAGGRAVARARSSLIASQTVMAMILLVSAGLLIKSLWNIARVDLGFAPQSVVTFRVSPELSGYSPEQSQKLLDRLRDELARLPGVIGVTASSLPILAGDNMCTAVSMQGFAEVRAGKPPGQACLNLIGADYFGTLGVPLITGHEFSSNDLASGGQVAIVNQRFVEELKLGNDAVGRWLSAAAANGEYRIVGIVRDIKYGEVKEDTPPQYYVPYRPEHDPGPLNFYVRSALPPQQILALAAQAVARIDSRLPVENAKSLERQAEENVFLDRLMGSLCVAFAVLATMLAGIGLYGTLSYTVTRRNREIGVRMALGARPRAVAWPIVRNALGLAAVGVACGGLIALGAERWMRHVLFGVEPNDPSALIGAGILLLTVAGLAAWIPARRASRIDPMIVLRAE